MKKGQMDCPVCGGLTREYPYVGGDDDELHVCLECGHEFSPLDFEEDRK